ncbi:MAG: hypothetical protein ACHRHE_15500, partial [Tepidisphaerales bacterium]
MIFSALISVSLRLRVEIASSDRVVSVGGRSFLTFRDSALHSSLTTKLFFRDTSLLSLSLALFVLLLEFRAQRVH